MTLPNNTKRIYYRYNYYKLDYHYYPNDFSSEHYTGKEMNHKINIGTGIGGEVHLRKFVLSLRIGCAITKETDPEIFYVGPVIEFGTFYKF